jgi:hypothetical protein
MDERCDEAITPSDIIYRHGYSYTKPRACSEMHVSHFKRFCIEFGLLLLVSRSIHCFDGYVVDTLIHIFLVFGCLVGI